MHDVSCVALKESRGLEGYLNQGLSNITIILVGWQAPEKKFISREGLTVDSLSSITLKWIPKVSHNGKKVT